MHPMRTRALFSLVAVATLLSGGGFWWATRAPRAPAPEAPAISASALWAAKFLDTQGRPHTLGEFQGSVVVVNFWATWCAPCREEMPGFARLSERYKARGIRFVGLADDDAAKVERFGRDLAIGYPLWVGGEAVGELSRRLGNRGGGLPHTVILDPSGGVLEGRVGPYPEDLLETRLKALSGNAR